MTNPPLPPAAYIDNNNALNDLIKVLRQESLLAIDTESNSLHAYRERVCLFQISTRKADYIVDPLAISDMRPLEPLLADRSIEKVFHSAEYDVMCMKRDYGFEVNNIFDTQVAARILGRTLFGLGDLLAEFLGIEADKRHQRDDWGRRPLPRASLLYAQMDTHYLPHIRDRLYDELVQTDSVTEAREILTELDRIPPLDHQFDPDGYWRIGVKNKLGRRHMGALREIYLLRERLAEQRDCPPFKVFGNPTLVFLARNAPHNKDELGKIKGLSPGLVRLYSRELLQAIEKGQKAKPPHAPAREPRVAHDVMERFNALREWRKQRASARGVESDIIVSKDVLWILAEKAPGTLEAMQRVSGLGPWRLLNYGHEMLDVIRRSESERGSRNGSDE